jgi:PERQ amino acid-rich with GYF domain-containing protein
MLAQSGNMPSAYDQAALKLLLQQQLQQQQHQQQQHSPQITNQDPKVGPVSLDHPEAEHWFYLDPQNQIQGAFSSEQMAGWLTAGYFTPTLMVKRGCDDKFLPLGIKQKITR